MVAKARGILGEKRVGHAGTLDPDATGVLLLGVGSVTRLLRFLSEAGKRYVGEVVMGTATDTLDAAGQVTATYDMSTVTLADVRAVVDEHLMGDIEQVPPMVSALKVDGHRLHELAREGIEVPDVYVVAQEWEPAVGDELDESDEDELDDGSDEDDEDDEG